MNALAITAFIVFLALLFAPAQIIKNTVLEPMLHLAKAMSLIAALLFLSIGAFSYNDSGYCSHIRTIFGSESSKCDLGWYFSGWGRTTTYPHYITVTHTNDADASGSSVSPPYSIRMADNWAGEVTQTTRFGLPQDEEQFLRMAREFRSPERLISTTLQPTVTSSLDSIANLFTMEEYYAGGRRDDFKTEFFDAITKGRAKIERIQSFRSGKINAQETAPSDSTLAEDDAKTGGGESIRVVTKKKLDASGNPIRIANGYSTFGITASTAIIQNLDPDDLFEEQIQERKASAARRSVAGEKRLEQEEQRLFVISNAEREIAEKQGQARVVQIQKTTNAETEKRLALINADKIRSEARISKETAQINFERAEIDAKAVKVEADATAYAKAAVLTADGALAQKLATYEAVQRAWADAFARRAVPATVMGSSGSTGSDGDVANFLKLQTVKAAKDLQLDLSITSAKEAN